MANTSSSGGYNMTKQEKNNQNRERMTTFGPFNGPKNIIPQDRIR